MFEHVTTRPMRPDQGRSRLLTGAVSAAAHVAVLVLLAIPALYATDALPEPPDMLAFVVETPPPPPPPPPPPAPAPPERPKRAVKPRATPRPIVRPEQPKTPPAAAPVEAPEGIHDETGLETSDFSGYAGFEGGIEGGVPGGVIGGIEAAPPPPPPPPPPKPVRIGGHITPPRLTHRVEPTYPLMAQSARIAGIVILEATVDERGRVTNVRALRSHPVLEAAATRAVEQWRYQPLVLNGVPTPFILTVTVSFSLGER